MKTLTIPAADRPAFDALRLPAQEHVALWLERINELWRCLDAERLTPAAERLAQGWAIGFSTLIRYHYQADELGWRGLISGRLLGKGVMTMHPDFREWWHGLVLENQRNTARAHARFAAMYFAGEPIPGLPPGPERGHLLPRGLSKGSLCAKRNVPRKAALVLARQGVAAARSLITTGPQDIREVRPLEYILFDDVELDFLVTVPESRHPVKLRLIVAMDLCSRVVLGYVVRPAVLREDGREDGLKLRDMKACGAWLLAKWGVPLDYQMHWICERGTAHVPDAVKAALAEITDGRLRVHDTSMIVGRVFEWRDRATGNSWGKAWLESNFNLLHNELQHLAGQKGRRYDLQPAELHGRKAGLALLEKMGQRLPIEERLRLRRPFLGIAQALPELEEAFARMHDRHDHKLLCFDRVGIWKTIENEPWKTEWEFPEHLAAVSDRMLWDSRMEKPMERFLRRLPEAERRFVIAESSLQRLMEEQRRVPFRGMGFTFELEKTDYTYLPPETMLPHLQEDRHYILWFHPQEMGVMYVTRDLPHRGFLGTLRRFSAGKRGDLAAAKEYLAEQRQRLGRVAAEVQQSKLPRIISAAEDAAFNADLGEAALRTYEMDVALVAAPGAPVAPLPAGMAELEHSRAAHAGQRDQAAVTSTSAGANARMAAAYGVNDEDDEP